MKFNSDKNHRKLGNKRAQAVWKGQLFLDSGRKAKEQGWRRETCTGTNRQEYRETLNPVSPSEMPPLGKREVTPDDLELLKDTKGTLQHTSYMNCEASPQFLAFYDVRPPGLWRTS
ncbi:uncharacterized protein SPSK_04683 [Sporothrix schenckii 1099-18]|uniref:Uncharacterized protein n=1 Tax=Sporothrix schenckii 1099-18 TaxID=1397361 RepID=A0A0F2M0N1_SPOSC|nr:uncharacterized protein SPSK_04683 [Sporothrix schenckii 1099-18]KJR83273.1 hypothetical protein SPSK_04683 [Sporothrix schenckii 1099-18]